MSNVSLLISREFRTAVCCSVAMLRHRGEGQYARHQQKRGKAMILLMGWLALSCLLCSLAGPASAVLMIPRYDWFHETDISRGSVTTHAGSSFMTEEKYMQTQPYVHYPNVFIAPQLDTKKVASAEITFQIETYYWVKAMTLRDPREVSSYLYSDPGGEVQTRIEAITTLKRPLIVNSASEGVTTLSSVMTPGIVKTDLRLHGYGITPKNRRPQATYSAELVGIEANTRCRKQEKRTCGVRKDIDSSLDWCYRHVTNNSLDSPQQSTQNLLLIYNRTFYDMRLWITEGPVDTTTGFSDSIVIILEDVQTGYSQEPSLVVCSISAEFKSGTFISAAIPFSPEKLNLNPYISYFDGTTTRNDTRKLLHHSSWLESIHGSNQSTDYYTRGNDITTPCHYTVKVPYPCRGSIEISPNEYLRDLGLGIIYAVGYGGTTRWWYPSANDIEASLPETIIGGLFTTSFLGLNTSKSQYPQSSFTKSPQYPENLMKEPIQDHSTYTNPPIKIERLLYGFKLSSRTSILSVVVLIVHAILVLIGSLWQYRNISLTQAWGSIPEYAMLCLGSDSARATCGVENTCAGIGQDETLNKVVRIREVSEEHLELLVVSPETTLLGSVVNPEKRYGALGQEGRMKEKPE